MTLTKVFVHRRGDTPLETEVDLSGYCWFDTFCHLWFGTKRSPLSEMTANIPALNDVITDATYDKDDMRIVFAMAIEEKDGKRGHVFSYYIRKDFAQELEFDLFKRKVLNVESGILQ